MAMTQLVWSLDDKSQLMASSLTSEKELEDLLYEHIEILNEGWLVVGRQVRTFSEKYIDLLCIDHDGDMVVVAAQMDESTERIIRYLRDTYDVDINILFFQVFEHCGKRLISRVWFEDDAEESSAAAKSQGNWNGEYYVSFGEEERDWEDARKLGFISAGGGTWYSKTLGFLSPGDRVWVNIPHTGYVGVGIVTEKVASAKEVTFLVDGEQRTFDQIDTKGNYLSDADNEEKAEYVVRVNWVKTVAARDAVKELGFFGNQNTVCRPVAEKWNFTVERLKKVWGIE